MNIIITGFMGSGKTTIGRKLAKLIEYSFVDTDSEIEDDQGCSVSEIFKYGGEECFREMETRLLELSAFSKTPELQTAEYTFGSLLGKQTLEN